MDAASSAAARRDPLDPSNGPFAAGYARELAATAISPEVAARVARQEALLVGSLETALRDGGLWQSCGIRRVSSIGSTDRGTYVDADADYDLMVETRVNHAQIPLEPLAMALRGMAVHLSQSAGPAAGGAVLEMSSLGLRGTASLVARFEWRRAAGSAHFLDITLGDSPRPVNYSRAVRHHLEALPAADAERLRREIRLAKRCLKRLGQVYGSAETGLRPMTIEQWVIQGARLRESGCKHGSFDNALAWVAEQAVTQDQAGALRVEPFAGFKARNPLWRPGADQGMPETGPDGERINLFDLLGNNQPPLAQEKWRRLACLALVHQAWRRESRGWSVEGLVQAAERVLHEHRLPSAEGRELQLRFD